LCSGIRPAARYALGLVLGLLPCVATPLLLANAVLLLALASQRLQA
jgi:hypothetical protein